LGSIGIASLDWVFLLGMFCFAFAGNFVFVQRILFFRGEFSFSHENLVFVFASGVVGGFLCYANLCGCFRFSKWLVFVMEYDIGVFGYMFS